MIYDTLKTYKKLLAAGMPEPQALAVVDMTRAADKTIRFGEAFDQATVKTNLTAADFTGEAADALVEIQLQIIGVFRHEYRA